MSAEELKTSVAQLPAGELADFSRWFEAFVADHPGASAIDARPDEAELARRRELGKQIAELRARTVRPAGSQVDSVDIIREMRDHPRYEPTGH